MLNFYLGSVAICYLVTTLSAASFSKKIEREGYKTKKTTKSFVEKLNSNLQVLLKTCIPVFNIIITLAVLFKGEEIFEKIKEEAIKNGELIPIEEEKEIETEENNISNNKSCFTSTYDELSIKEKIEILETEKERLIEYQNSSNKKEEQIALKMRNNNIYRK